MSTDTDRKSIIFPALASLVVTLLTFFTDRSIFVFPEKSDDRYAAALCDYCICKIAAAIAAFAVFYLIYTLVFTRSQKKEELAQILKYAALYLPVMLVAAVIKLPAGFLTNDEYSIYNDAVNLIHDTWFNYMTVYYYIVSLMLIPVKSGPIIMKMVIEFFVIGYCVWRSCRYYGKKHGMLMYVPFLLYPVIAYTTSAHRLPVYFLLYLFVFVRLLFDRLEKQSLTVQKAVSTLVLGAVLTQWRTEGIYLLVLIPLLMFIVYENIRKKSTAMVILAAYLLIQYIISVPQTGFFNSGLSDAADDRMKPFYAYTITNMFRNGLDTKKNADDLAVVDRYLAIDAIDAINEHYGDINYEDVLILYQDGFVGVREEAGYKEFAEYADALKRIFVNNCGVFLKTRWGAFCYAALPYKITFSADGVRALASSAVSIVKTVTYELFGPVLFVAAAAVYALFKKRWYSFFVFAGLMAHFAFVFILAPASYFKYYFPVYIMAYAYAMLIVAGFLNKDGTKTGPVV